MNENQHNPLATNTPPQDDPWAASTAPADTASAPDPWSTGASDATTDAAKEILQNLPICLVAVSHRWHPQHL